MADRRHPAQLPPTLTSDKQAALQLVPVSRETERRLDAYVELLRQWNAKTNLVAPSTLAEVWTRHVADSLQLMQIGSANGRWIDLGSGGGFPGVVIACALGGSGHIDLVERNAKKAAFLREALRVTGGAGTVHLADIGDYVDSVSTSADYITARALAPLKVLLGMTAPLIARGGRALFLKGQDVEAELTEAAKYWNIAYRLHPSLTSQGSFIVDISSVEAKTAARTRADARQT